MRKIKTSIYNIFFGKRILILGYGREGKSTLNFLRKFLTDANITIADKNTSALDELKNKNISLVSGDNYLNAISNADIVMKSPGVSLKNFNITSDVYISSQTDLFIKLFKNQIIGVTGTKGKSTTSSLIYHILKENMIKAILVGNIGIPALDKVDEIDDSTLIVYELSSHQLEFCQHSPHISVLLNLFQEHLDHYNSYHEYRLAKWNIAKYQTINDFIILNNDDIMTRLDKKIVKNISKNILISADGDKKSDIYFDDIFDDIFVEKLSIGFDKSQFKIIGKHNIYNLMVCLAVSKSLHINIVKVLQSCYTFKGLAHRLEYVGNVKDIDFVNDSIATIPEAAISAIKSIINIQTIILGGLDRKISYDILIDFLTEFRPLKVILLGEVGLRLNLALELKKYKGEKYFVNSLNEAVDMAFKITRKKMACVLSPAAASYDKFKNFEERGDLFKKLVNENKLNS